MTPEAKALSIAIKAAQKAFERGTLDAAGTRNAIHAAIAERNAAHAAKETA